MRHHAPNVARSGRWATTACCAATRPTPATSHGCSTASKAAMCFTDPPYNVALGDHGGQQQGQRRRRIENDALPPEQWEAFVRGWAQQPAQQRRRRALHLHEHARSGRWSRASSTRKAGTGATRSSGPRTASSSAAPTTSGSTSRSGTAGAKALKHYWCGDRDQGDVWKIERPSAVRPASRR